MIINEIVTKIMDTVMMDVKKCNDIEDYCKFDKKNEFWEEKENGFGSSTDVIDGWNIFSNESEIFDQKLKMTDASCSWFYDIDNYRYSNDFDLFESL